MTRRTNADENIRKISKRGNSYSMTVPIDILKSLGWKEWQKVVIKKVRGGFVVRDWKK